MRIIHVHTMPDKGVLCKRPRLLAWLDSFGWRWDKGTVCSKCSEALKELFSRDAPKPERKQLTATRFAQEAMQVTGVMVRLGIPVTQAVAIAAARRS